MSARRVTVLDYGSGNVRSVVRALEHVGAEVTLSAKPADVLEADGTLDPLRYGGLLRARGLVGVRGAGSSFDGLWYVRRVSTRVTRGAVSQSFGLSRDGLLPTVPKVAA